MLISKQYRVFKHSNLNPAVVLGINPNGNDMELCLAKRKINTYMVDFSHETAQSHEASIEQQSEELLNWLQNFIKINDCVTIFPSSDKFVLLLAKISPLLDNRFKYLLPDISIIEQCIDKYRFFNFCKSIGIEAPETHVVKHVTDIDTLGDQFFPCIVKPYDNKKIPDEIINKVRVIDGRPQLRELAKKILNYDEKFIAQKMIDGGSRDRYFVGGIITGNPDTDALFIGRKLREAPLVGGTTTHCRLEWNDIVYDHFRNFADKSGYVGLVDFEMMHDKSENRYKLIEINPRIGAWHLVSKAGNNDIIYYYYNLLNNSVAENYSPHSDGKTFLRLHNHYCSLLNELGFFRAIMTATKDLFNASAVSGINLLSPEITYRSVRVAIGCTIKHLFGNPRPS